jgi:N-acetylneuraminic acid mutarotase
MRRAFAVMVLLAAACSNATTPDTVNPTGAASVPRSSAAPATAPTSTRGPTTPSITAATTTTQPRVWRQLARMRFPRSEMPAVTLDGLIHVPGGFMETAQGAAGQVFHEAYDPVADEWSRLADMPDSRHHHMAAAVDGFLYVFGGFADAGSSTTIGTNTWRYSPASDQWEALSDMPTPVAAGAAVADGDGGIVIVGGVPAGTAVYRYSVADDDWQQLPSLRHAREHNGAAVAGGSVYALGGRWEGRTLTGVETLAPGDAGWSDGPDMLEARSGFAATVWNGTVIVGGGEDLDDFRTLTSVEVLGEGEWKVTDPLPVPLHGFAFVTVDGHLYSVGGSRRAGFVSNSGEMFARAS